MITNLEARNSYYLCYTKSWQGVDLSMRDKCPKNRMFQGEGCLKTGSLSLNVRRNMCTILLFFFFSFLFFSYFLRSENILKWFTINHCTFKVWTRLVRNLLSIWIAYFYHVLGLSLCLSFWTDKAINFFLSAGIRLDHIQEKFEYQFHWVNSKWLKLHNCPHLYFVFSYSTKTSKRSRSSECQG